LKTELINGTILLVLFIFLETLQEYSSVQRNREYSGFGEFAALPDEERCNEGMRVSANTGGKLK